jgi:phenylpyruvate tautomerase PptA (4-oxalocrotonate tautomerase family)
MTEETTMPVCLIDAPAGIRAEAKKRLMEKATAALDEAYHVPDVRIFLREYPAENVAQDGRLNAEPVRPVCFIEAPQLRSIDARRTMARKINAAIAEAYEGIANTRETLILHNEYPLENAGWGGRLQSDNPEIVEAMKRLNG